MGLSWPLVEQDSVSLMVMGEWEGFWGPNFMGFIPTREGQNAIREL